MDWLEALFEGQLSNLRDEETPWWAVVLYILLFFGSIGLLIWWLIR